jgi:signal peptidase I
MRRADRGRAAVFAPADVVDRAIAFVLHDGPSLLVTAAVLLLVWLFVAEPRQIPSHSMEPTLSPTDRLIVWKWGRGKEPDRWDVVLFPSPADGRTLIKRAVGLGGEQVQIDNGDVWADGKMLVKPDDLRLAVRERLDVPSPDGPEGAAAWAATGDACGRRAYAKPLFADEPRYVGSDGRPEPTSSERPRVHDVYLEADVVSDASGHAGLYVEWVDDGDRPANRDLGIAVTVSPEGVRTGAYGGDPCGSFGATVPSAGVPAGRSSRLSLSLVDGVLRAGGGGTSAWSEVAVPKGHARILVAGTVRGLVVHRDVHYTQPRDATYAVNPGNPAEVPEGSIFCLGDHSSNSRDSRFREVGFIPVSSLVGKAVFRVWPLNRVGLVH